MQSNPSLKKKHYDIIYFMKSFKDLVKKQREREEKLREALFNILNKLKELGALKIILFGSFAQDNIDVNSDLDLLVIMPNTKTSKEWSSIIYETIERKVAVDFIVFNERDFNEEIKFNIFLNNIIREGKVIYEKTI